jgi:hypothetical protein
MKYKVLAIAIALLLLAATSVAQRRGSGNAGMQGAQSAQRGSGGQMRGSGSGMGSGDQQRLRIHATDQQRLQLKSCTQSADRIRIRTRQMSRLNSGSPMTPEQARQFREQLRSEVQAMNQNHEQLMADLSEEQRLASRQTIAEMERSRTRLMNVSEMLDNELVAPELNQERIREQARETERAATQLKDRQSELSAQLSANQ